MGRASSILGVCTLLVGCGAPPPPPVEEEPAAEAPLEVQLQANRIVFNRAIRFTRGGGDILPESVVVLDRIVELLAAHPNLIRVQVQGHTSTEGSAARNRELSEARATAVADYLRSAGVEQDVTSQGYGETYPVCQETSEECGQRNRRVEFFVDER